MEYIELRDPLTMSLTRQLDSLYSHIHHSLLENVKSQGEIVETLTRLLHDPRYTLLISKKFRPLLIVLCARWLEQNGDEDQKLFALALLIDPHEELYPILSTFLRNSFPAGPLTRTCTSTSQLHRVLLAYYRILVACPYVPTLLQWSHESLSSLISTPHTDMGIRWLTVRCYALHTRMSEAERNKLELSMVGPAGEKDVPVESGTAIDGQIERTDGWLLPALEVIRIQNARRAMVEDSDFHDANGPSPRLNLTQLTRDRVVDVHGVLLLRDPTTTPPSSRLVSTDSTSCSLRALAVRLSLRLPTLISSPPSSGKTLLLDHLASLLYPNCPNQLVTLHLSDTSLDARSLLGSYVSSTRRPGTFEWQEGVVVRAMQHGLWLVLEDIDRASSDVLGTLIPLVESLALHKPIGAPASLDIPGRGRVNATENFALFATRSVALNRDGKLPPPTFLGVSKFSCVDLPAPTEQDLTTIINGEFPKLGRHATQALIRAWTAARALGSAPGVRDIGIRDLETWCRRIENLLPSVKDMDVDTGIDVVTSLESLYPHVALREEMYLEGRAVFFGAGAFSDSARAHVADVARIFAEHLALSPERAEWLLQSRIPELQIEKDNDGRTTALRIGRTRLAAERRASDLLTPQQRPFAMHRPALLLTERISAGVVLAEPILLVGETGTGKTTLVSHVAGLLHRPLVSLNLSHQTESADLLGGFKPVDARVPGGALQRRFMDLFARTFSRRKNGRFEDALRKAVNEIKWKRAVGLWKESARLAVDKIRERAGACVTGTEGVDDVLRDPRMDGRLNDDTPRKRRKFAGDTEGVREVEWVSFERDVEAFDVQHVQAKGKFAFGFVEGPLVEALRNGHWVLLDEINLASPETLECISSILQGPTASVVLTEQGSFAPVSRHPDFRLIACMNPATDVGKKDLPPNIRSRFTEIHVPPPDADRDTLLAIVHQYIGHCTLADKSALLDVAEFYIEVKELAERRELANGSNQRPHFSMRTLARALTFTSDVVTTFGIRRALWEGCLMAFSMALDEKSAALVKSLAERHLLTGVKNVRAMITQIPGIPGGRADDFIRMGPFWLERGSLEPDPASEYILTPSVQSKLVDLSRVILTRRFPVLIEGPTSSGKTSAVEYLARRTGHRFVRVNNHEHTDIQEYLGTYVSDPKTGKLVFHDGILVRALRNGDWIVLDELNLAPTDVLEALNRLLDDNRELVIPETQEVITPHPHFILFATQNPPGLYAGRKILSRAFRNRFLEVHFDDVPQSELQTILSERCRIPDSYAQRIVAVFQELSKRRQAGRVFETKHGFATLRDLFRWAGREASSTQQLAQNGYMLLAERARRPDDKAIVKEIIETVMKERLDTSSLYDMQWSVTDVRTILGVALPASSDVIWTSAMKRLFVLVANALKYNEPVLLVGETGSGKTSVCQLFAAAASKQLLTLNCHQSTETADLIGGQRPLRNRRPVQADLLNRARETLRTLPELATAVDQVRDVEGVVTLLKQSLKLATLPTDLASSLSMLKRSLQQSMALFEWYDGPLIRAMRSGDVFLLDEISLADDSVLERLNSVLEGARTIVLAERGGFDVEHAQIIADPGFKILATMNPGGDYGKKELSPALRNRFTEIWVSPVDSRSDQRLIIDKSWRYEFLLRFTDPVLDFTAWLASTVGDASMVSLRDLLTWVNFTNDVCDSGAPFLAEVAFHHAAHMVFLDGLESCSLTSSWSTEALQSLRARARGQLEELVPLEERHDQVSDASFLSVSDAIRIGAFAIPKGPCQPTSNDFSLQAPTTLDNMRRLVRACQVSKPILLEGSPGVGKTSLVSALGDISGHRVCRINLSDQTDLMDLFGSDLPVEGGRAGEFAWKDAAFLRAMQDGDWVLLDEMNLAPQAVLEGLNAALDHRGTVFVPELGRSFTKHPRFRIFAAQNPLYQGGGRKGLPRSFVDRFTKVYVQALSPDDLFLISQSLFPMLPIEHLQAMILFNVRLHEETMIKRSFGREGSPWEFNLRDVIRWATLLVSASGLSSVSHPSNHLDTLYLQRFRTEVDRTRAKDLFLEVFSFPRTKIFSFDSPWHSMTPSHAQFGSTLIKRGNHCSANIAVELQRHLRPLTAASACIQEGWLTILSGDAGTGKTQLARYLAAASGCRLHEFPMSSGVDTADLLGSFEQTIDSDDDAGRFEWVDGPLVEAIKNGFWLLLDNANLCNPSVLDRLNSLCETHGVLVLTERGHVHGEVQILKPHPRFRLVLTLDAHNGELSRAMRNRAIEIHLPTSPIVPQDHYRVHDAARIPFVPRSTEVSLDALAPLFDLVRRGHSWQPRLDLDSAHNTVHSSSQCQDSVTSTLLDHRAFQCLQYVGDSHAEAYARTLFSIRALSPANFLVFDRFSSGLESCRTNGPVAIASHLSVGLVRQGIWKLRRSLGEMISHTRGVPLSFISYQPFDLFMNPGLFVEEAHPVNIGDNFTFQQRVLSRAIELDVHIRFSDHTKAPHEGMSSTFNESRLYSGGHSSGQHAAPGLISVFPLYSSTIDLANRVLQTLDLESFGEQLVLLEYAKHLVDCAEHLRISSSESQFDFTSARVISTWFHDILAASPTLLTSPVAIHVEALANEVSLTTGHGMQEIWCNLVAPDVDGGVVPVVSRIDCLAAGLDPAVPSYGALRLEALNAMALLTVNTPSSIHERESITALCKDVEQRLVAHSEVPTGEIETQYSAQLAIAELDFFSTALSDHEIGRRRGDFVLTLASQTPYTSLARLTQVQHHLWALDASGVQIRGRPAGLISMIRAWMSALHGITTCQWPHDSLSGPDLLLKPILLCNVVGTCRHDQALDSLDSHERALHLQGTLAVNHCFGEPLDRMDQIICVWKNTLLLLGECFKETYSSTAMHDLGRTAFQNHSPTQAGDLTKLLASSNNNHVARIVHDRLEPASWQLDQWPQADYQRASAMGKAWIAIGLTFLELYVPNIPLDPVAAQRCTLTFWKRRETEVLAQVGIHSDAEKMVTGYNDNPLLRTLRSRLGEIRRRIQASSETLTSRDIDIGSLHALFGEIVPFLSQVINTTKFDLLVRDLETSREDCQSRLLVTLETISGFILRLEQGYSQLADVVQPISMALTHVAFGLQLLGHASRSRSANPRIVTHLRSFVKFPTASAIESIPSYDPSEASSTTLLLLNIVASAYNVGRRSPRTACFSRLDNTYDKLTRLWLEDREGEHREVQDAHSLYRHKRLDRDTQSDAEVDEQEFRAMFPSFEEEESEPPQEKQSVTPADDIPTKVLRLSVSDVELVYRIHLWIIDRQRSATCLDELHNEYHELRNSWVGNSLDSHSAWLPHSLDADSLSYQVLLLSNAKAELNGQRPMKRGTYNFYHDPNIPEVKKAVTVVRDIQQRLRKLLKEWPEQMVLHHIMMRCEAVLKLNLHCPIAKVLSTLEQLLLQTEDWEIYSNRDNSLKPQQAALSELIVEWRRLELSCWSQLLESQSIVFSVGTAEWWFRLYELTIRGTTAATADGTASLDAYFTQMIPLVEQFVTAGPLGQYAARLRLLESYGQYTARISNIKEESETGTLIRTSRILQSLHNFYSQFSDAVSHSLAERRAALEKELSDYIKLASWKDVNVHALKQSAQRTHRQLYNCMRKFRELLRQPVAPFLAPQVPDTAIQASLRVPDTRLPSISLDFASPVAFLDALPPSDGMQQHLRNLPRTFSKFKDLLKSYGQPIVDTVLVDSIDHLAGQIADTVTSLSTETNAAGSNPGLHKTLVMRKRKAWIDLLKELKHAGLSSRLRPEILEHQQNKLWLMDRLPLTPSEDTPFFDIVSKGEAYLNRLLLSMPELRRSLSSHHGDLPTRELERAVTFVESSFSLALSSRSRFGNDYTLYRDLDRTVSRLKSLSATQGEILGAYDISPWLELSGKLEDALGEISSACVRLCTLGDGTRLAPDVLDALSAHYNAIQYLHRSLYTLYDNLHATHVALMTTEERDEFEKARTTILSTVGSLGRWVAQEPRIHHLCGPTLVWLNSMLSDINITPMVESHREGARHENIVDRLLLVAQGVFSSSGTLGELGQSPDKYASGGESRGDHISRILAAKSVAQTVSSFVDELTLSPPEGRIQKIQSILPFIDAYLCILQNHILVQAHLAKSLFKLSYVLCCVVLSLATKGFCKPSNMEESSGSQGGDGAEIQDGTGLGQGTGSENISNEIEDESQVEGLRGEETGPEPPGNDIDESDGIEMADDFEGEMGDIDRDGDVERSDDDSLPEPEDQVGDVGASNQDVVDEKLWGDENVAGETPQGQTSKDNSTKQNGDSEVVAKENEETGRAEKQRDGQQVDDGHVDSGDEVQGDDGHMSEEQPIEAGRKIDDFVPEANTLDLPDDMDLGGGEDGQEELPDGDDLMDESEESPGNAEATEPVPDELADPPHDESIGKNQDDLQGDSHPPPQSGEDEQGAQLPEPATGQVDLSAGDDPMGGESSIGQNIPSLEDSVQDIKDGTHDSTGATAGKESSKTDQARPQGHNPMSALAPTGEDVISDQNAGSMTAVGTTAEPSLLYHPLRSLGDTLKEIRRRFDQIGDAMSAAQPPSVKFDHTGSPSQVEYLHEGMGDDNELQAFGPAREDQVAKLRELNINEELPASEPPDRVDVHEPDTDPRDIDSLPGVMHMDANTNTTSRPADIEAAVMDTQVKSSRSEHVLQTNDRSLTALDVDMASPDHDTRLDVDLEHAVKQWQETGHSDSRAGEMWRLYDSLTQDLSHALCEQLRLILEPTLATRLRGDYRTGKRLNMKKIIPYIASEYTKDKIWLRRTRPSQREYQVLIALDDSRSMAESRSVHLAYETLALVSKALNRLESGEVAIARFGESVEIVHGFEEGMVGHREGEKVMRNFKFEQRKTDVLGLVEASLKVLTQARERRSMGRSSTEAADLWQLEIIISDGICQDHDKLRIVLRKAEEQRVMIVFIVVDSLHAQGSSENAHTSQDSILSMNQVSYKDTGGGRMELQMERYLDTFPFQYYVVLRSVDALPDVLSGTLKQFFERISEQ